MPLSIVLTLDSVVSNFADSGYRQFKEKSFRLYLTLNTGMAPIPLKDLLWSGKSSSQVTAMNLFSTLYSASNSGEITQFNSTDPKFR
jgi:hypothetical protein